MPAPTAQECAKTLAQLIGVTTLNPDDGEPSITPGDLRDIAIRMSHALAEILKYGPVEARHVPGSGFLRAPIAVTLTGTYGSNTISALTPWDAGLNGCTIRIQGDNEDNELIDATTLGRPYEGETGANITGTVYSDCVVLGGDVSKVLAPILTSYQNPIYECVKRGDFIGRCGYGVWNQHGLPDNFPFWSMGRKAIGIPCFFFLDSHFSPVTGVVRKIRFAPMPMVALGFSFSATANPPRITVSDIQNADHSDPGRVIPVIDGRVESIFLPIASQLMTGLPTFKQSADTRAEIFRQYMRAIEELKSLRTTLEPAPANYR